VHWSNTLSWWLRIDQPLFGAILTLHAVAAADYTNLGCYALRNDRPPLPQLLLGSPKMTPGSCAKKAAAYKFFALFNGTRCYAGNDLAPSLRHGRGSSGCTTPCSSNKKQRCGGPAAFMVYVNHEPQAASATVPLSVGPAGEVAAPVVSLSLGPLVVSLSKGSAGEVAPAPSQSEWHHQSAPNPPTHPTHPNRLPCPCPCPCPPHQNARLITLKVVCFLEQAPPRTR
jgi:hypothetical protein